MKNLIKTWVLFALVIMMLLPAGSQAITLTTIEINLMNNISRFIDAKPEGQALKFFEHAIRSESVALKGLASIILTKHYHKRFQGLFLRNFTLNPANDNFLQEKKVLVKLDNANKLLAGFDASLKKLDDARVRQLFLFYHFRHKNVWMLGGSGEELSLASFYRISVLNQFLGETTDAIKLSAMADQKR